MISVLTTVDLRFEYFYYVGSQLGEYIPEICVELFLTDPDKYYDKGWEGFFNIIGTTTTTTDIILRRYSSSVILTFEVTWNATHLKPCFTIEYSNIASFVDDYSYYSYYGYYSSFLLEDSSRPRLYTRLFIFSSCKSIVMEHVGL